MVCACTGNAGNVFPVTACFAIQTCITARASHKCRDACRDRLLAVFPEAGGGEHVPDFPGACANRNFTYLVGSPYHSVSSMSPRLISDSNLIFPAAKSTHLRGSTHGMWGIVDLCFAMYSKSINYNEDHSQYSAMCCNRAGLLLIHNWPRYMHVFRAGLFYGEHISTAWCKTLGHH